VVITIACTCMWLKRLITQVFLHVLYFDLETLLRSRSDHVYSTRKAYFFGKSLISLLLNECKLLLLLKNSCAHCKKHPSIFWVGGDVGRRNGVSKPEKLWRRGGADCNWPVVSLMSSGMAGN